MKQLALNFTAPAPAPSFDWTYQLDSIDYSFEYDAVKDQYSLHISENDFNALHINAKIYLLVDIIDDSALSFYAEDGLTLEGLLEDLSALISHDIIHLI